MHNMKKIFTLVLLVSCFVGQAQLAIEVEKKAQSAFETFEQTGAVVGLLEDGKTTFMKAYGVANSQNKTALNENTVFQVASLSKAFTAASIGILVDRKALSWDDLVIDHYPEFKLYDAYVTRNFKIKDLLSHHNGYNTFDGDLLWYESNYSTEEIMDRFARLAPKHGFREKYGYSNIMFIAAAKVIEIKSGKTWEEFVQTEIMDVLDMTRSTTDFDRFMADNNKAYPHIEKKPDAHRNYNNGKGAVGVKTTAPDLLKWANMWLNNGVAGTDTLLKAATVNYIQNAHTAMQVSQRNKDQGTFHSSAGLGWFLKDQGNISTVSHSGGLPGLILNLCLVPEKKSALVVLTNDETLFPFALTNEYIEALKGEDKTDWIALYKPYSDNGLVKNRIELPKKAKSWLTNLEVAGIYTDAYYGEARVFTEGSKLIFRMGKGKQFVSNLLPMGKTNYRIRFKDHFLPDGIVTFSLDSKGNVDGFTIDLPNPDFHFYNLDFKKN